MDALTIIASIASILGALFALFQYYRASKAATLAVEAKNEILSKKKTLDLNFLFTKAKDVEALVIRNKSNNISQSRGVNHKKDLLTIEDFISLLNEKKSLTVDDLRVFLDAKYTELTTYSESFRAGDIQPIISEFSLCIRDLISRLTDEINSTTYS